jgi:hypothetical protein
MTALGVFRDDVYNAGNVLTQAQVSAVVAVPGGGAGLALNSAASYEVGAGTAITGATGTVVNGNVALYPGTSETGFPPGVINGQNNINNAAAQQAIADARSAYNAGQALTGATVLSATTYELGGTSPAPGLYSVGTSATITGTLTLNAAGNPNAIWIFQIGSTFLPQNASVVLLTNGAQAKNVYFLVGSSATIGTTATVNGQILALTSVTVNNGATTNGMLFGLNGAVTFSGAATATSQGQGFLSVANFYTAGTMAGAQQVFVNQSGASGALTLATDTALNIIAWLQQVVAVAIKAQNTGVGSGLNPPVGVPNLFNLTYTLTISNFNTGTGVIALTGGAGVTLFGTTSSAVGASRTFVVQVISSNAVTMTSVGAANAS